MDKISGTGGRSLNKQRKYAASTTVSAERSETEVKILLRTHGASQVGTAEIETGARLMFRLDGRMYRFDVIYTAPEVLGRKVNGEKKSVEQTTQAIAADRRRRWRVLVIRLKVAFELIADGESTPDQEFFA